VIFRFALKYELRDAIADLRSLLRDEAQEFPVPFLKQAADDLHLFPTYRGREALYLILKNLGLRPGARVGVPLYVCSVVAKTVVAAGMTPVFIDADPETFGLSLTDLENKATNLESLILVYTFGYPNGFARIKELMNGRPIIEDCAHSMGSSHLGRPLGLFSEASFFSFGFFKPLSGGGGGCVITRSKALAAGLETTLAWSPSESTAQAILHIVYCFLYVNVYKGPAHSILKRFRIRSSEDEDVLSRNREPNGDNKIISSQLGLRRSDRLRITARLRSHGSKEMGATGLWTEVRRRLAVGWHIPPDPSDGQWNHFVLPICAPSPEACTEAIVRLRRNGVDAARIYPNCVFETRAAGYAGGCAEAERLAKCVLTLPSHGRLSPEEQSQVLRAV
jgi:perosamine synthetase